MAKFRFICKVKSASATSIGLSINDSDVDMKRNGDTWSGTSDLTVSKTVAVAFFAKGFQGIDWNLEVDIDCPQGDPDKILSKSGTVPKSGISQLNRTVTIPEDPCSSSDN